MYQYHKYKIDWDKVKSQDDIITILKGLNISWENPNEELKNLCKIVKKTHEEIFD